MSRTRLAPSPTGALHLGNARTFVINWVLARQRGWDVVLRIEDLDGPRVKSGAAEEAIDILEWFGLDWDEGPYWQRAELSPYQRALEQLAARGAIYPCHCSRKQIEAASLSAPHGDEHEMRYPGTCRPSQTNNDVAAPILGSEGTAWRVHVPSHHIEFTDQFAGDHSHNIDRTVGDFLVATKQGLPSYQLAVVVDDERQGIDQVVRGDDLLTSTARQLHLINLLKLEPRPNYTHLPLVIGEDGRRLAKRHGDSRLSHYRQLGVSPQRILGLLAEWCNLGPREEITIDEFRDRFRLENLSHNPIVFTPADDAWLLAKTGSSKG